MTAFRDRTALNDLDREEVYLNTADETLPAEGEIEAAKRLSRDLKASAKLLSKNQARFLVDRYYQMQGQRIRAQAQMRAEKDAGEPNALMRWSIDQFETLELDIAKALDVYSKASDLGLWARSILGIGPITTSGLLAHVDVAEDHWNTAGSVWRLAGLDPTVTWGKGEKRPWNAELKVICYKIGESFVKVQHNPGDSYGHVYADRKRLELQRNNMRILTPGEPSTRAPRVSRTARATSAEEERVYTEAGLIGNRYAPIVPGQPGQFAEQAAHALATKNYGLDTEARFWYEQGMLPPAQIHARSRRYAVKLYLAHYIQVAYEIEFRKPAPKPYILEHSENRHVHFLAPPNWPMAS